jgi:Lipid A 3-O-deacylase (PagL)
MSIRPGPASRRIPCAWAAGLLLLAPAALRAEPTETSVVIATGQYGMRKEIPHSLGIELQIRPPWHWSLVRPTFGLLTSANGGAYVFSGLVVEIPLPAGFELTPGFAPGVVLASSGGDLGYPVEFRSSLEVSWSPGPAMRLGLAFSHISNAHLGDRNPGVETLMLSFVFPGRN